MNKNDKIILEIIDVTDSGNGIGKYDNTVVFVPNTAVGDIVTALIISVKKNYCVGKLLEIKTASPDRIPPDCDCFERCGGCAYRHITYDSELSLKQKRAEDCIKRIAKLPISANKIITDRNIYRYRNKAQFPVDEDGNVGFYSPHSHRIVQTDDCLLQPLDFSPASKALKIWMQKTGVKNYNSETNSGLIRHLYIRNSAETGDIMVVLVINGDRIPKKDLLVSLMTEYLGEKLKSLQLNINKQNNNVILGKENITLFGKPYIYDTICGVNVRLSPNSFYQVNRDMAQMLYMKAKEYANPNGKILLDLYCGTGTIGLTMADEAEKVIGVEIVEEAIKDAKINAVNNNIKNADFICADALEASKKLKKDNLKPDIVIIDPPRKGCDSELIRIVANDFAPEKVVYVSCDPSTLARDVKLFDEYSYRLVEYTPFDLFPRTVHVETVALLVRTDSAI